MGSTKQRTSHKARSSKENKPTKPEDIISNITSLLKSGKADQAFDDLMDLCRKDEELAPLFHLLRGGQLMQRGRILDGSTDLEIALQREEDLPPEAKAWARMMLANAKIYINQPEEALELIQDASEILPATFDVVYFKALALLANGMYTEALSELSHAREALSREKKLQGPASLLHQTVPALRTNLEGAIEALIGNANIGLGNVSEARVHFLRVMDQYDVLDPDLLLRVAAGLIQVGEYKDVIRIQKHLADAFPDRPEAQFVSGLQKLASDGHTAVDDIEAAILKDPVNDHLLLMKYHILMDMKDYEAAMRTVNRWVSIRPTVYLPHLLRGTIHAYQGNYLGAVDSFSRARDLSANTALCHLWLAVGLSELGRKSEAEESLKSGVYIDNKSAQAEYAQGRVALNGADLEEAVRHLLNAKTRDPENGEFHYYLGLAYHRKGDYPEAERSLSKAGEQGFAKAFDLIREIRKATDAWIYGPTATKRPWEGSLKEAADKVLKAYASDCRKSTMDKRFTSLRSASGRFFVSHSFPRRLRLTRAQFYENVKKATRPRGEKKGKKGE